MPVFGQSTDFNDRLCSLMSAILYNTNTIYDGGGHGGSGGRGGIGSATTRQQQQQQQQKQQRRVHVRPLFTKAILQKAERLNELKLLPSSSSLPLSTTTTKTIIEVILVVDKSSESHPTYTTSHDDDNTTSSSSSNSSNRFLLSKLISQLFSLPADIYHLDVITVRSHSIQKDLIAASSTSSFSNFGGGGSDGSGGRRRHRCRRRVWVALGSAITGLYQYLLLLEGQRLKHRLLQVESKESSSSSSSMIDDESSSSSMILGVICIDPPSYLWKSYGKSILYQTCLKNIPSLFVVSDQDQQQQQQYDHNSDDNEEGNSYNSHQNTTATRSSMVGVMLRDCSHHPHALVVITNDNGTGTGTGNKSKNDYNHLDYYVWLARLITKYTESIQRLRTPPRTPPPPPSLSTTSTKATLTTTEEHFLSKL